MDSIPSSLSREDLANAVVFEERRAELQPIYSGINDKADGGQHDKNTWGGNGPKFGTKNGTNWNGKCVLQTLGDPGNHRELASIHYL